MEFLFHLLKKHDDLDEHYQFITTFYSVSNTA